MDGKMETKVCTKCGEEKPATREYYTKKSSSKDGLATECKTCKKKRDKDHYEANKPRILENCKAYAAKNKDKISKQSKARYDKIKDTPEHKARRKEYYDNHKEEISTKSKVRRSNRTEEEIQQEQKRKKEYYEEHKDKFLPKFKAYRKSNKKYIAEWQKEHANTPRGRYGIIKRSAKQRGIIFEIDFDRYEEELWGLPCHYCEADLAPRYGTLDRMNSNGGYTHDNVVPCCSTCNSAKNTIPYKDYVDKLLLGNK